MTHLSANFRLPEGGTLDQLKLVEDVTVTLMHQHGLTDWTFGWDHAKRRGANTNYTRKMITGSPYLHSMWTIGQSTDLMLHEIAHALAGPDHHHDAYWRKTAQAIGATGNRCWGGLGEKHLPGKYELVCAEGHTFPRFRKTKGRWSCNKCGAPGKFDARYLLKWREVR
jgi:hypothetical protein